MLAASWVSCGTLCRPASAGMSKVLHALAAYAQTFAPACCLVDFSGILRTHDLPPYILFGHLLSHQQKLTFGSKNQKSLLNLS